MSFSLKDEGGGEKKKKEKRKAIMAVKDWFSWF